MERKSQDRTEIEDLNVVSAPNNTIEIEKDQQSISEIDAALEKKVLWKTDLNLVPILFLLYICSFMDRINIGNARIQGLERDLKMEGNDYNITLCIFFVPYILFEVPSNLLLKRVRPSLYLSALITLWGIVTICQGVTTSYAGLVVCRVIIGALEAGFFPGCLYLLSMFYKKHELQRRFTLFFSASIFAGSFSGLLAYAIAHMDGYAGYEGWRWIFIIEGLFTVACALLAYFIIPDWPETARYLKPHEREILIRGLVQDCQNVEMNVWNQSTAKRVFTDVKIYLGILMAIGTFECSYSAAFFIPTILKQLGWTAVRAQIMSIPIYLCAATCTIVVAIISDKIRHRFAFVLLGAVPSVIGYIVLLNMLSVSVGVRYFTLFIFVTGGFVAQPITIGWLTNNLAGHYKRSVGIAMQIALSNCGGLVASNVFLTSEAPEYPLGFGVGLGFMLLTIFSSGLFFFYLRAENRRRDAGKRDYLLELPEEELGNLGDDHPRYRYTY